MLRRQRKYTIDTNLYIRAIRSAEATVALQQFHTEYAPFEFLSAVVVKELLAGARNPQAARRLQQLIFRPFEHRGRLLTPSYAAWKQAGEVLSNLVVTEGLQLTRTNRGFESDVLLAMSCREAGVTLVTENRRDFERIARMSPFEFVDPWPSSSSH